MTRTAAGLQAAPAAAALLLVAGVGLGSLGGYWFADRHTASALQVAASSIASEHADAMLNPLPPVELAANPAVPAEIASVSGVERQPNSNLVEVTYKQVEPMRLRGTLDDPKIRQLLMLASQNGASSNLRDDSIGLLAAECRSGHGCQGAGLKNTDIRDVLMVSLRYDRSATVRHKALEGLQPFVSEDMQVRDAVLEALMNDPDAHIRSTAISMLEPVEADTSVRQVLSTVALSDQNSNIRTASRSRAAPGFDHPIVPAAPIYSPYPHCIVRQNAGGIPSSRWRADT